MVLHLLGKKSWNVYNSDNIEKVRRDEAEAKAREEAEEQRMQEEDSARRIAILRGEQPPALQNSAEASREPNDRKRRRDHDNSPRKRRRLRGEDDTDRDIRYAREDNEASENAKQALLKRDEDDAPLHDRAGNIQLIAPPDEKALRKAEKNAEAEAEKAKKIKRDEDQYTMRFSNAAGYKSGMEKPWYTSSKTAQSPPTHGAARAVVVASDVQDKDVWGNEDPLRREREQTRISTNDPFAAMQQAQRQLKQSEADKEKWRKLRLAEVEDLERSERERRKSEKTKKKLVPNGNMYSLEGFSLDGPPERTRDCKGRERSHRRHYHHHRRRSRSRSRDRHH